MKPSSALTVQGAITVALTGDTLLKFTLADYHNAQHPLGHAAITISASLLPAPLTTTFPSGTYITNPAPTDTSPTTDTLPFSIKISTDIGVRFIDLPDEASGMLNRNFVALFKLHEITKLPMLQVEMSEFDDEYSVHHNGGKYNCQLNLMSKPSPGSSYSWILSRTGPKRSQVPPGTSLYITPFGRTDGKVSLSCEESPR